MLDVKIETQKIVNAANTKKWRIDDYWYLIKAVHQVDVTQDKKFQCIFKDFWGYVKFDREWHPLVYEVIEKVKAGELVDYKDVLTFLSLNDVNKLVASKVLATVYPAFPIWDSRVADVLGPYDPRGTTLDDKITDACNTFSWLQEWYKTLLSSERGERIAKAFDEMLPQFSNLPSVKKIDYLLWSFDDPSSVTQSE